MYSDPNISHTPPPAASSSSATVEAPIVERAGLFNDKFIPDKRAKTDGTLRVPDGQNPATNMMEAHKRYCLWHEQQFGTTHCQEHASKAKERFNSLLDSVNNQLKFIDNYVPGFANDQVRRVERAAKLFPNASMFNPGLGPDSPYYPVILGRLMAGDPVGPVYHCDGSEEDAKQEAFYKGNMQRLYDLAQAGEIPKSLTQAKEYTAKFNRYSSGHRNYQ